LPRVNGFARWDWNSALRPWAGQENWTAGIAVSLPLLHLASQLGETGQAAARRREATAGREAAHARAELDRQQTAAGIAVALRQLDLTEQTIAQAEEAHRLVSRRYEGGLSTIADLLSAQSTLTESRLRDAAARWQAIDAAVRRLHALGADPAPLVALDTPAAVAVDGSR
ncbi:MAG: TolC family protein, partial [Gemmatimonadaceae bacterium]|nr:TolC family protein [Gemmatimonadaceae bacterium]